MIASPVDYSLGQQRNNH